MRSKKNSSLILLGVFTLGITQSYVVEALPKTSANLAKEINDESKQQDIDVQQGTDVKSVDSKGESFLCINDVKKTKNMSKTTKAIICVGTAGIGELLVLAASYIIVKKTLDSKRNIDSEQDNSNKNNNDSERDKEIEKDPDDQKEKADNQDSKDEVKDPDSKSISYLPFIMLGVVAMVVVVGIIVFFVRDNKIIAKDIIDYLKENEYGDKQIKNWRSNVLKIKKKIEKNLGENGLKFSDLVEIFKDNSLDFLRKLSESPDSFFNDLFNKNNKEATKVILFSVYEETIEKFFDNYEVEDVQKLFCLFFDISPGLLSKYLYFMDRLEKIPFSGLAHLFDKYRDFCFLEALLGGPVYQYSDKEALLGRPVYQYSDEYVSFLEAILNGTYKKEVKLVKDNSNKVIEFPGSIKENIKKLYEEYKKDPKVIETLIESYEDWSPSSSIFIDNRKEQKN